MATLIIKKLGALIVKQAAALLVKQHLHAHA